MDCFQEAGRAGRNGEKADDITIHYGQQQHVKNLLKILLKQMVASGKEVSCHLIQMLN